MHLVKIILILLLPFALCAQRESNYLCSADSIFTGTISSLLDTMPEDIRLSKVEWVIKSGIDSGKDQACRLLLFAKVFDFLLFRGLDINYSSKPQERLTNYSGVSLTIGEETPSPEFLKEVAEMDKRKIRYNTYREFLDIKSTYETFVKIDSFSSYKDQKLLIHDVSNIMKYNTFRYPLTVENILLLKYEHLTLDELMSKPVRKQ